MTNIAAPIINLPTMYVNNLQVSTFTNTTVNVAAGQCRDSTNTFDMVLNTGVTINGAVNGLNGLDTGSLANTSFYYIYVISDPVQGQPTGCLLSLSSTTPTLPSGYLAYRRIGSCVTNGSAHFYILYVYGDSEIREYYFDTPLSVLSAAGNTSYTAASLASAHALPATSNLAFLQLILVPATAGNSATIRPTGSSSTTGQYIDAPVISKASTQMTWINTSALQSIDYITTSGSDALTIRLCGFKEYL